MIRRPVRLAVLLVPTLLLAGCSTAQRGPSASAALSQEECAGLVVIGTRGSTQDPDRNLGVGTEVRRTVEELARRVTTRSRTSVHLEPVRYDASLTTSLAEYDSHTAAGARMVVERLDGLASRCPGSSFALVGFSQGAQVVHEAAAKVPAGLADRIALLAMIADPRHDPSDRITQWSYADRPTTGAGRLGAGAAIPPALRDAAISLCVEDDEICNDRGAPGGPASATHRHFYERATAVRATARQLDLVLARNGV